MFLSHSIVFGLALPLIVAAGVLAAGRAIGRRLGSVAEGTRWGIALGVGAGDLVLHLGPHWRPAFPPIDVVDRTPWLALVATVFALIAQGGPGRGAVWWRRIGLVLLAALVFVVILGPVLPETVGTRSGVARLVLTAVVMLAAWSNLEMLGERVEGAALLWPLVAIAGGTGVVLIASGSVYLGQLGLALMAALAAPALATWRMALGTATRSVIPIVLTVTTALVLNGQIFSGMPTGSALLLAASPAGLWATRIRPVRRRAVWLASLLAVLATLVPVGLALVLAMATSPAYEYE